MKTLSIRAKLLLLAGVALAGIALTGVFGLSQLARSNAELEADLVDVKHGMQTLLEVQSANVRFKTQVQEWKNILVRGNDPAALAQYRQAFVEQGNRVQQDLQQAEGALKKESHSQLGEIQALRKAHADLGALYLEALKGFDPADPNAGKKLDQQLRGKDRAVSEAMTAFVVAFEKGELKHMEQQLLEARQHYNSSRNWLLLGLVLSLAVVAVIIVLALRQIDQQISLLRNTVQAIQENLDLTRRIPLSGQDEMGRVAAAVNSLLDEFQQVVSHMKRSAEQVAQSSAGLTASVGQLNEAVRQQNESTASMAAAVEEVAVSVSHVAASSRSAQQLANNSMARANEGEQIVEQTVGGMTTMADSVQGTSETIARLGKRSDEIGHITGVIKEIADQTNLLALNAAIEAARAGELGRGFAVVADEVRKLAERTGGATAEISGVIHAIQQETGSAVAEMEQSVLQVGEMVGRARSAGVAIGQISRESGRVVEVSDDISSALQEQSAASDLIARQVELIASASERNAGAMQEVRQSTEEMKRLSDTMQGMVARFRV